LVPQLETGKINCVRLPRCDRLPPGECSFGPFVASQGFWHQHLTSIERAREISADENEAAAENLKQDGQIS
jgi:hypothetical protein